MISRVGRAGQAAVAVEADPDEPLVGQVVTAEHRGDPLEERGLGERTGGGQQAEHGPFDAIGERHGGAGHVLRVGQPPATGLDLRQAMLGRPAELLADQREQAVDRVDLGVTLAGAAGPGGRPGRLAGSHVRSARAWGRPRIVARRCGVAGRLARAGGEASRGPVRPPVVIRRSSVGLGLVVIVGARGPVVGGGRVRAGRRECPGGQPANLPGPIEPDQDLAEQPLVARRLAPGAQRLDRDLGHGPRGVGGRERPPVEPLGRREQAGRRDEVRVAGAPGHRLEPDVGAGARSRRQDAARVAAARRPPTRPRRGRTAARRAAGSRPTPRPSTAATIASGPPSTSWTTRPSRAMTGSTASSARPIAAACQLHGGRSEAPARASIGSSSAASRPSAHDVA